MARCGCTQACACAFEAVDTFSVDLTLAGNGAVGTPYSLTADVILVPDGTGPLGAEDNPIKLDATGLWLDPTGLGGGGGTAATTTFAPAGGIASTDVQAAIVELDAEALHKAGAENVTGVKTFLVDPIIPDEAFGVGWNGVLEPTTKNAVYDQFQALRVFQNGVGTVADASVPGFLSVDIADVVPTMAVVLASHMTVTSARFATQAPLPACTYNNGAFGVGATLTADANGALGATGITDHVAPAAGDRALVKNQADPFENGIYAVTDLGSGGTPFILTRVPEADLAAEYLDGISCKISEGVMYEGATFSVADTVVMGTTAINWEGARPAESPADAYFSLQRDRRRGFSDFAIFTTDLAPLATVQPVEGTDCYVATVPASSTAAAVTQVGGAAGDTTAVGAIKLDTGTTTTGTVVLWAPSAAAVAAAFSSTRRLAAGWRLRIPTLSAADELFAVRAGYTDNVLGGTINEGIYFEALNDNGNWDCVCVVGGVENRVDSGQPPSTGYRDMAIYYDPVTAEAYFFYQVSGVMAEVSGGGISTNLPTGIISPSITIKKQGGSTGTTTRAVTVDYFGFDQQDNSRTQQVMVP